ncbi:MAG: hypothetical protein LBD11_04985 [Candidatus Peribacteria bacterium]|jgi:hypothetical protein|nr:hypothetical protein [Candidatus Peribacteria bacterium]
MSFPFATNTKPTNIYWETWSGLTGNATNNQIKATYNGTVTSPIQYGYGISTTSL